MIFTTRQFKDTVIKLLPRCLILPLRFYFWKITGGLEKEISILKGLVDKKKCAIDIGANEGIYSYALSKLCDKVESFEPQTWCAETLRAYSSSRKSQRKINVHNVGLSNLEGILSLYIPLIEGKLETYLASFQKQDGEHQCVEVPVKRLDDYNFKDVSFIKIDVEGHELEVIRGARNTILREKPILLVEIEQRHLKNIPIYTVFDEIKKLGYEGSFLQNKTLFDLEEFSYETHQKPFESKRNSSQYINNFIFTPKDV